jgi:hypothetical protein
MKTRRFLAAAIGLALCLGLSQSASASSNAAAFQAITLCHASPTGQGSSGPAKSYELISVDNQGELNGHLGHPNDIIPAPEQGCPNPSPSPSPLPSPSTSPSGPPVPPVTPPVELVRYRIFTTMPRSHQVLLLAPDLKATVTRGCRNFTVEVGETILHVRSYDRTFLRVKSQEVLLAAAIGQKHGC